MREAVAEAFYSLSFGPEDDAYFITFY